MLLSDYVKQTANYCKNCRREVVTKGYFYDYGGHVRQYESVQEFYSHVRMQVEAQISLGEVEPDITTVEALEVLGANA